MITDLKQTARRILAHFEKQKTAVLLKSPAAPREPEYGTDEWLAFNQEVQRGAPTSDCQAAK